MPLCQFPKPSCLDYYTILLLQCQIIQTKNGNIQIVTGNIPAGGDSDWYRVLAEDTVAAGEESQWECPEDNVCVDGYNESYCWKENIWGTCIEYRNRYVCTQWDCPTDKVNTADEDPWTFEILWIDNPGGQFGFNVYKGGPPGGGGFQVCNES